MTTAHETPTALALPPLEPTKTRLVVCGDMDETDVIRSAVLLDRSATLFVLNDALGDLASGIERHVVIKKLQSLVYKLEKSPGQNWVQENVVKLIKEGA